MKALYTKVVLLTFLVISSTREITGNNQNPCYGDLGCFPITKQFHSVENRILNVFPQSPDKINTTFTLYVDNDSQGIPISRKQHLSTKNVVNFSRPIKMIVHGFLSYGEDDWAKEMRESLLEDDVDVIVVDWYEGARPIYLQATANTRVVGAEIALFLMYLKNTTKLDMQNIHIIGHSLGAHIAGYAGERIRNPKIGRITGLDPAQLYFTKMSDSIRLSKEDASFVDVIHSNTGLLGLGLTEATGHVDFYPDGGRTTPSCDTQRLITAAASMNIPEIFACDHMYACHLFTQSIKSTKCKFVAHACSDYQNYKKAMCSSCGKAGEDCQFMGYYARQDPSTYNKNFFLTTGKNSNFCLYHWKAIVEIENSDEKINGNIHITIHGTNSVNENIALANGRENTLGFGDSRHFLIGLDKNPGEIKCLQLQIKHSLGSPVTELLHLTGNTNSFKLKYIIMKPIDVLHKKDTHSKFCFGSSKQELDYDEVITLYPSYCDSTFRE